jgi:hypothetical protein
MGLFILEKRRNFKQYLTNFSSLPLQSGPSFQTGKTYFAFLGRPQ